MRRFLAFHSVFTILILALLLVNPQAARAQWRVIGSNHESFTSVAVDEEREVLVGYLDTNSIAGGEIWEFDGTEWELKLRDCGLVAGRSVALIYERSQQRMLLFASVTGPRGYSRRMEVWSWKNGHVKQLSSGGPSYWGNNNKLIYADQYGGVVYAADHLWLFSGNQWRILGDDGGNDYSSEILTVDSTGRLVLLDFPRFEDYSYGIRSRLFTGGVWKETARAAMSGYVNVSCGIYDRGLYYFLVQNNDYGAKNRTVLFTWNTSGQESKIISSDIEKDNNRHFTYSNSMFRYKNRVYAYTYHGAYRVRQNTLSPASDLFSFHRTLFQLDWYGRSAIHVVHNARRDSLYCISPGLDVMQEYRNGTFERIPMTRKNITSAIYDVDRDQLLVIRNEYVDDRYVLNYEGWDGRFWQELSSQVWNIYADGVLYKNIFSGNTLFFFGNNLFERPGILLFKDGRWRLAYRTPPDPRENGRAPCAVALDGTNTDCLVLMDDNTFYRWDGKRLYDPSFVRSPFIFRELFSRPGGRPLALGNRVDKPLEVLEWNGSIWRPIDSAPFPVTDSSQFSATYDPVHQRIIGLSVLDYANYTMWAYGPYPGTGGGARRAATLVPEQAFFRDPVSGQWVTPGAEPSFVQSGVFSFTGVFGADRKLCRGTFDPATGRWQIEGRPDVTGFGTIGDLPVVADYNGNGTDEIAYYRPSTGEWRTPSKLIARFGGFFQTPVPADYDGDGAPDPALYDARTGTWTFTHGVTKQLGGPDCWPVPADYDGDGAAEIAVWNSRTGIWSSENNPRIAVFGKPDDQPVPGRYDDPSHAQPALYRPRTGQWIIDGRVRATLKPNLNPIW